MLSPGELTPVLPAGALENGERLSAALKALEVLGKSISLLTDGPPARKLVAPGKAIAIFRQDAPAYGSGNPTWGAISEQLKLTQSAFDKAAAALEKPVAFPIDYGKGASASTATPSMARLVAILRAKILHELHAGDLASATESIEMLAAAWRASESQLLLVPQVMALGVAAFSMDVVWEALQAEGWNEQQLQRIQEGFLRVDLAASLLASLEMERAMQATIFDQLRESQTNRTTFLRALNIDWDGLFSEGSSSSKEPSEFGIWLRAWMWKLAWSHQDEAEALRSISETIAATREWHRTRNWSASRRQDKPPPAQWRFILSNMLPGDAATGALRSAARILARLEMLHTAVALMRYHLRHHRFPEKLDDLIPEFLPAMPVDWMDGKPLRYRLETGGSWLLYSVGLDGKDDGGDPQGPGQEKRVTLDGNDTVWPKAVSR